MKRTAPLGLTAVAIMVGAVAAAGSYSGAAVEDRPTDAARIETLTASYEIDGTITFGPSWVPSAVMAADGRLVTAVESAGSSIATGQVLFRLDNQPTVAIIGDYPAWRTMSHGDEGDDVLQLEMALVEMGYTNTTDMTVDGVYTSRTADVVEAWQEAIDATVTGTVGFGDVVFVPPTSRVASVAASVGDQVPATGVIAMSTSARILEMELDGEHAARLSAGDTVAVELPDRSQYEITIDSLLPGVNGKLMARGAADVAEAKEWPDVVPVTASWDRTVADQAVTVDAGSLRRIETGDYAVEMVDGDSTRMVMVTVGAQSGGRVAVDSLTPGDVLVRP